MVPSIVARRHLATVVQLTRSQSFLASFVDPHSLVLRWLLSDQDIRITRGSLELWPRFARNDFRGIPLACYFEDPPAYETTIDDDDDWLPQAFWKNSLAVVSRQTGLSVFVLISKFSHGERSGIAFRNLERSLSYSSASSALGENR